MCESEHLCVKRRGREAGTHLYLCPREKSKCSRRIPSILPRAGLAFVFSHESFIAACLQTLVETLVALRWDSSADSSADMGKAVCHWRTPTDTFYGNGKYIGSGPGSVFVVGWSRMFGYSRTIRAFTWICSPRGLFCLQGNEIHCRLGYTQDVEYSGIQKKKSI